MTVKHEIPKAEVDNFLDNMMEGGMENALIRFGLHFIPDQNEITKHAEEEANEHPLHAVFPLHLRGIGFVSCMLSLYRCRKRFRR